MCICFSFSMERLSFVTQTVSIFSASCPCKLLVIRASVENTFLQSRTRPLTNQRVSLHLSNRVDQRMGPDFFVSHNQFFIERAIGKRASKGLDHKLSRIVTFPGTASHKFSRPIAASSTASRVLLRFLSQSVFLRLGDPHFL